MVHGEFLRDFKRIGNTHFHCNRQVKTRTLKPEGCGTPVSFEGLFTRS